MTFTDIYVPNYTDVLRVSFTHIFHRGKIADLATCFQAAISRPVRTSRVSLKILSESCVRA